MAEQHVMLIMDIDESGNPAILVHHYQPPAQAINAQYAKTPIRLRSEEHFTYVNTGAQLWTMNMTISASVERNDNRTGYDVERDVNFLRSLNYPDYGDGNDNYNKPPHRVHITAGKIFKEFGVITGFSATPRKALDIEGLPMFVDVSFSFEIIHNQPLSYRDVRLSRV